MSLPPSLLANGRRPTREQTAYLKKKHGRSIEFNIFDRVRTPIPGGETSTDLTPILEEFVSAGFSREGAFILCVLFSIETNAGRKPNNLVACYNHNLGNHKLSNARRSMEPCYFLVDKANSVDVYPSFVDFKSGTEGLVSLLRKPWYNKPGEIGAIESLSRGNIRDFNDALGRGGYAEIYKGENAMAPRARLLVKNKSLPSMKIEGMKK